MKKINVRSIQKLKNQRSIEMLTCYDFQTAQMLNETELDLILVGDSLGNVMLGYPNTIPVSLNEMITFSAAVKRGATDKFVIADLPFGTYASFEKGLQNAIELFQKTSVEALKLEGCSPYLLELIERLIQNGVPIMGHIGLQPQSVHQLGGYYTHGKNEEQAQELIKNAQALEKAGVFSLVLECVEENLAKEISQKLSIPTIGIGSGSATDGQVLVINDLLQLGSSQPPKFCQPIANLYQEKKKLIQQYLKRQQ